jgi:hypothetical protein
VFFPGLSGTMKQGFEFVLSLRVYKYHEIQSNMRETKPQSTENLSVAGRFRLIQVSL